MNVDWIGWVPLQCAGHAGETAVMVHGKRLETGTVIVI